MNRRQEIEMSTLQFRVRDLEAENMELETEVGEWCKRGTNEIALQSRVKELEAELITYKYEAMGHISELQSENALLRKVVDAASGLLKAMTKQSHWARKAVEPEAFALSDLICELEGDGTLTHEESKKHSEAIKSLFKCRSTRCRAARVPDV